MIETDNSPDRASPDYTYRYIDNIRTLHWTVAHEMALKGYKFDDLFITQCIAPVKYDIVSLQTAQKPLTQKNHRITKSLNLSVEEIIHTVNRDLVFVIPVN